MLGVLSAGRGFVPLDASQPLERNRLIASQADVAAAISAGDLASQVRTLFPQALHVVDINAIYDMAPSKSDIGPAPGDLAFIVYTSGSTGRPKGAYHTHRNLLHDVLQQTNTLHLNTEDRVALVYSPVVVGAIREIMLALLNGAALHILPPNELQPTGLVREIESRCITIFRTVPPLLRRIAEALGSDRRLNGVRVVGLGSQRVDWSDYDLFRRHFSPEAFLIVGIGATECGGNFAHWFVDERERIAGGRLPIGRVLPDVKITIEAEDARPVQDGEVGEFVLASRYIALGYWRDSALTAETFSTDLTDPATRIFKTGDIGRLRPDGLLEYAGRKDQMVKLRGHRVEIGEIEFALCACPGVEDAAVVVRKNEAGEPQSLIAYVEARPGAHDVAPAALTSVLAHHLPAYMVPAAIVLVDELPRLPNLKLDRVQLGLMDGRRKTRMLDPIEDPVVNEVAQVFKQVLSVSGATPEDNVASLGGDSLQAVKVAIELENRFGVAISGHLFDASQTIVDVARWIALHKGERTSPALSSPRDTETSASFDDENRPIHSESILLPLPRISRYAPLPLSLWQELFWTSPQAHQTVVGRYRIVGPLDIDGDCPALC
jgi:amino acid adenylation domain-containing protein